MKPTAGHDFLTTAAHLAAEASALVYHICPEDAEMKLAFPNTLFCRDITDGRAMMHSIFRRTAGVGQATDGVEYGK
eukprot:4594831-Alexandrium_andersonii.AAC.1